MGKKRVIWLTILLVAIVGGLASFVWNPAEPAYKGKLLTSWLEGYSSANLTSASQPETDRAVRAIGTNAIPTLLHMLQKKDSTIKLCPMAIGERQSIINIKCQPAVEQINCAIFGFGALGAEGREAVPRLIEIYDRNISEESRYGVINSLGRIGPPATNGVPLIINSLNNPRLRYCAITALGEIHFDPDSTVPALIPWINDPDRNIRILTVMILSEFGQDAKKSVPTLMKHLYDNDAEVRRRALYALQRIDPMTNEKLFPNDYLDIKGMSDAFPKDKNPE